METLKKTKLKQGTLAWEKERESRIGSSEIFDIVRYYATDDELQYCGLNAEDFRNEKPYTTVWALYHKLLSDGLYNKEALAPEFAEYGHAAEPYGVHVLQRHRTQKLKQGPVYIGERLIASLDIEGVAESVDEVPFCRSEGCPEAGRRFVCEQKTMMPTMVKRGLPFKYIIQAQYQLLQSRADFFILQLMVLDNDTPFIRGKICQMPPAKRYRYLDEHMTVTHYYFNNHVQLGCLIEKCIGLFFEDVDNRHEPKAFLEHDSARNVIESIRLNSAFNDKAVLPYDLSGYRQAKAEEEAAGAKRKGMLQELSELAKAGNACRFYSEDGWAASFCKDGSFRLRPPREGAV